MENQKDLIWLRAQNIANCGALRINKVDELDHEYETKNLLKTYKEACEAETIIKKQLIDLYQDRKHYIEAMDAIADEAAKCPKESKDFWNDVMDILKKENEEFKLERSKTRQRS